jgi:hypothetical protein
LVVCGNGQRDGIELLSWARETMPAAARCLLLGDREVLDAERLQMAGPCLLVRKPWETSELALLVSTLRRGLGQVAHN